jgi:hypothetical protein
VLAAFIVLKTLGPVSDPDAFWHIAAGGLLRSQGSFVITPDPWSATATEPWILHQWAPEFLMSLVDDAFGLPGVAWLQALWSLGVVAAVWLTCRARASILVATVVTAAAFLAMSASIAPRPQMFTFIFTAITVHAWLRTAQDRRPRWWLIPLTWTWACCHGLWFLGPILGVVAIVGLMADRSAERRDVRRLLTVPIASVVAAALTPVGPILLTAPFHVGHVTHYISEWQPTRITELPALAMALLISIPILRALRQDRRLPWVHLLLLGFALAIGLMQVRTVGVAAVIAAPVAATSLHELTALAREAGTKAEAVITASVATVALVLAALIAPTIAGIPGRGPNGLNPALDALPAGTVICNDQLVGGWLIWRHPDLRVTFDTRVEIYTEDFIDMVVGATALNPGWDHYLEDTGCRHALLIQDSPFAAALAEQRGWIREGSADGMVLLSQPTAVGETSG